jgi:hypothetical protein
MFVFPSSSIEIPDNQKRSSHEFDGDAIHWNTPVASAREFVILRLLSMMRITIHTGSLDRFVKNTHYRLRMLDLKRMQPRIKHSPLVLHTQAASVIDEAGSIDYQVGVPRSLAFFLDRCCFCCYARAALYTCTTKLIHSRAHKHNPQVHTLPLARGTFRTC